MKAIVVILLLFSVTTGWGEEQTTTLEEIFTPSAHQRYLGSDYPEKIKIIRITLQNTCTRLKVHVAENEADEYLHRLREIEVLGKEGIARSRETTSVDLLRDKEVKRLEIELRQTINLLEDLKLNVPLETREHFYPAVDALDRLRKILFMQLFEGARSFENELRDWAHNAGGTKISHLQNISFPMPAQSLHDLDRFTEEEFRKIQIARKLDDRVEAFMKIAEARLDEIKRRREDVETPEDEENPLEFYTYDDLLFAFNRALESAMISIDDDVERGSSRMDEIEEALEELNKGCKKFQPRLQDLESLVVSLQSLELAERLKKGQDLNTRALQGAEAGLKKIREREF